MPKLIDLTGQKFGRLTVIERAENKNGLVYWKCRCDCGNECAVVGVSLTRGRTKSCGCLHAGHLKHGKCYTKIYKTWQGMKGRCLNPNSKSYKYYGERDITVCLEWIEDFQAFYDYVSTLEHFGEEGYTLDRIDNNSGYIPGNLRWADKKTQSNNKRNNIFVEYQGKTITLKESSEKSGICYRTLQDRYRHGDRGENLFRPIRHK